MTWWQRFRGRGRLEDELDAELRFHFDRLVADGIAAGLPEEEARRRARAEFGGLETIKDACREARGTRWAHDLAQDVGFSVRRLAKERRTTLVAVFALALGIGVNNTMFTVVNAVCIRGLPVAGADRLVDIADRDDTASRPAAVRAGSSTHSRTAAARRSTSVAAYASRPAVLRDEERAAERVDGRLRLGRRARDDRPAADARTRLSTRGGARRVMPRSRCSRRDVWRGRYGADPAVVGRAGAHQRQSPVSIVGVMPDGFGVPGQRRRLAAARRAGRCRPTRGS